MGNLETSPGTKKGRGRHALPEEVRQSEIIRERVTLGIFKSYASLGGKKFMTEVIRQRMKDYRPDRRIKAEFFPQAWQDDYAVDVDPEGDTVFDVTHVILAMGKDKALQLKDSRDNTDVLRDSENAPEWIKKWGGPFYIRVEDSVSEYFSE